MVHFVQNKKYIYNPPCEAQARGVWKEMAKKKLHNGSENSEDQKKDGLVKKF